MPETSLHHAFLPVGEQTLADRRRMLALRQVVPTLTNIRRLEGEVTFRRVYDLLRHIAAEHLAAGTVAEAEAQIHRADTVLLRAHRDEHLTLELHAAMMQVLTALRIEDGRLDDARASAAAALTLLSQQPKRKDEPFLAILAALLYDIAYLHIATREYRQAERELEKALKLFKRLAARDGERYGPPLLMAQTAVTDVYRSRQRQTELLAEYQQATQQYLAQLHNGDSEALTRLVDSLCTEGRTLAVMGRHREAIVYFTRALRYLTRTTAEPDRRQLAMSISLGESLLSIPASREKGIHLLNTMLHKAARLNADDEHRRIVDILVNARTRSLDILGFWHKIFPR